MVAPSGHPREVRTTLTAIASRDGTNALGQSRDTASMKSRSEIRSVDLVHHQAEQHNRLASIALALMPFTPPGIPVLAASAAALLGLRGHRGKSASGRRELATGETS